MEDLFLALAKDSPLVALCGYLIWKILQGADRTLEIYRSGASSARTQAEAIDGLANTIQNMERSLGALETAVARTESSVERVRESLRQAG